MTDIMKHVPTEIQSCVHFLALHRDVLASDTKPADFTVV